MIDRLMEHMKTAVWYWEQNLPTDAGPTEVEELRAAKSAIKDADQYRFFAWHRSDVKEVRPDLSNKKAMEVLNAAYHKHDASVGINWDVLQSHADWMFPQKGKSHED